MKRILVITLLIILGSSVGMAQTTDTLEIGYNKTVYLVFDSPVEYYDVGSGDVLFNGKDNKVLLKAAIHDFQPTNLLIETSSGYYTFFLVYHSDPGKFFFSFNRERAVLAKQGEPMESIGANQVGSTQDSTNNEFMMNQLAQKVLAKRPSPTGAAIVKHKIQFYASGIYVYDDLLFIRIEAKNNSNIPFNIGRIKTSLSTTQKLGFARSSSQEIEVFPIKSHPAAHQKEDPKEDSQQITKSNALFCVLIFTKQIISPSNDLLIRLIESTGQRNLEIRIPSKALMQPHKL